MLNPKLKTERVSFQSEDLNDVLAVIRVVQANGGEVVTRFIGVDFEMPDNKSLAVVRRFRQSKLYAKPFVFKRQY
jgi:hypothetical protein